MTPRQFREHLEEVSQASADAMRARDRLREAEHRLTRPSSAHSDGTHVALGCVNRDVMTNRVESYQCARESAGRKLHESLAVLQSFKEELLAADLNDLVQRAMWLRYAHRMTFEQIGEHLEMPTTSAWRLIRDTEKVLAEHMGVTEPLRR